MKNDDIVATLCIQRRSQDGAHHALLQVILLKIKIVSVIVFEFTPEVLLDTVHLSLEAFLILFTSFVFVSSTLDC